MSGPGRTKIRFVIADLTIADGEASGRVQVSVTEGGRTETARLKIGSLSKTSRKPARKDRP